MKKIGLIFAMKEELEETKSKLEFIKKYNIYDLIIYECSINDKICYLIESGIGKVNAGFSTQILIREFEVDCVINLGVAGSVSKEVKKTDIVVAENLVQHDFDLTSFGREKGTIPNVGKYINCDKYLLSIAKKIKLNNNVFYGAIASGDIFVYEEAMGKKINNKFGALCVEMEGAAIAQVCYLCKTPFLVIRSISDSPYEKDNNTTFEEFLITSSKIVGEFAVKLLEKI